MCSALLRHMVFWVCYCTGCALDVYAVLSGGDVRAHDVNTFPQGLALAVCAPLKFMSSAVWRAATLRYQCHVHVLLASHQLEHAECWEDVIDDVIKQFEAEHQRRATYTICYY